MDAQFFGVSFPLFSALLLFLTSFNSLSDNISSPMMSQPKKGFQFYPK